MDKESALEVRNLSVSFVSKNGLTHKAVNDVSFSLPRGTSAAVVGESGSGKTTLIKAVLGLVKFDAGTVSILGRGVNELEKSQFRALRRRCGYMPQDPYGAIPPTLSVIEAVMEPEIIVHGRGDASAARERAEKLLKAVGLEEERILASRALGLSGGQRQRVELARALALDPELLLCDEPTSMQDASTRGDLIELLGRRVAVGMSMLFVTHDLILAARAAERILVMKDGALCEEGPAAEILEHPSHPYTKLLINSVPKI